MLKQRRRILVLLQSVERCCLVAALKGGNRLDRRRAVGVAGEGHVGGRVAQEVWELRRRHSGLRGGVETGGWIGEEGWCEQQAAGSRDCSGGGAERPVAQELGQGSSERTS